MLWDRCATCHRPGQLAPFSLLEYADVKIHARQIVTATKRRVMPPWLPEPGYGTFATTAACRPRRSIASSNG